MAVVFLAQVRFDVSAVLVDGQCGWLCSQTKRSP
jgi:hypothetical protein